jgi:hypothetical protein
VGVDPASTAVELAEFLQSPSVAMRERALAIARDQGAAARDLLPAVADMLVATQPKLHGSEWVAANEARTWSVDRTPHVQRLAAETIVAIAAADDPLVAKAREILARPAPEPEPDAGK